MKTFLDESDPEALRGAGGGAAWLSSARAVRCRLKCHNERNPFRQLPSGDAGHSGDTATARCEEGGDETRSLSASTTASLRLR